MDIKKENIHWRIRADMASTSGRWLGYIFQAKRLISNPTVADIKSQLENYNVYVPVLDDNFQYDELDAAIKCIEKGIGVNFIVKKSCSPL